MQNDQIRKAVKKYRVNSKKLISLKLSEYYFEK